MNWAALLVGGDKVLASILDPLDWPTQVNCSKRRQDFFGIEQHDLGAETPAYIGRNHAHFVFGQVKDSCQAIAYRNWSLCRNPAGEYLIVRIPTYENPPALHRHRGAAIHDDRLAYDMWRALKNSTGIANQMHQVGGNMPRNVTIHQARIHGLAHLQAVDDWQRLA